MQAKRIRRVCASFALSAVFLAVFPTTLVHASESAPSNAELKAELGAVLEEYKSGIMSVDGMKAYSTLSQGSRDFWEQLHGATVSYDRESISEAPFAIRMSILTTRALLGRDFLLNADAQEMFVALVEAKQLGYRSISSMGIGEIQPGPNEVKAELTNNGQATGIYLMHFTREESGWKFHSVPMFMAGGQMLASMIEKRGMDETEFLFQVIEQETGKTVDDSIWAPLAP